MKALKVIGLAIAATTTLTGCASLNGESDKKFDEGITTNSYAWNVKQRMSSGSDWSSYMPKDPDWNELAEKMLDPKNGYYLVSNTKYAPNRTQLEKQLRLSSQSESASKKAFGAADISNNLGSAAGGWGAVAGLVAWTGFMGKALFGTNGYVAPVMDDWLHDQTLFYVPTAKYPVANDADHFIIDSFKKAAAKADKKLTWKEDVSRCDYIFLDIKSPEVDKSILVIEQHRFNPGTDPKLPNCKRDASKDWSPSKIPAWMNKGLPNEEAWVTRIHGNAIIGSQRNKIAAIAKYLPDNFYIYIAPRIDDKTKKVVHPVVIDNKGMHEFIAPVSAK